MNKANGKRSMPISLQTGLVQRYVREHDGAYDDTQIRHLIIDRLGLTDYGKLKQARAEIHSRYHVIKNLLVEEEKLQATIACLRAQIKECAGKAGGNRARARLLKALIAEKRLALEGVRENIRRQLKELEKFVSLAQHYEEKVKQSGKSAEELEREFWVAHFTRLIELHTLWRGGNLSGTMENVLALPRDMQEKLIPVFHRMMVLTRQNEAAYQAEALAYPQTGELPAQQAEESKSEGNE